VLSSHEQSRDVKISSFSLTFHGVVLFEDTTLELNYGRRYGMPASNIFKRAVLRHAMMAASIPTCCCSPAFVAGLMGTNGAGKTTLLSAIAGTKSTCLLEF
jgi:ATPase subunit of ABC transporter with duplicated ATPase domains